jgi:uncharacterized membrane protein YeaQ/YmgE (transglycosylase-associated protein family)
MILLLANCIQQRDFYVQVWTPGFIGTIVIGLLAGWIAGELMRGRGYGCIVNTLLGLIGAFIGRWIFLQLGIVTWGFVGTLAAATVGAIVLVAIARLISGSKN